MDKKFKDMNFKEKIAYIIVVLLISSLLMGSFGGLLYLFSPKEHKTASADNSLVYEINVPIIWEFDDIYTISQGLIFKGNGSLVLDYRTYDTSISSTVATSQVLTANGSYVLPFACWNDNIGGYDNIELFVTVGPVGPYTSFEYLCFLYYRPNTGPDGYCRINVYDNNGNEYSITFYKNPLGSSTYFSDSYNNGNWRRYSTISDLNNMINNATQSGFDNGYDKGYDYGFDEGQAYGEDIGYHKGANDSEQFTFAKLLDAVFYAPIKAFTSIFNFDFLGVNLLSIVSFILTVCIVVGLLKWLV